jgi:TMEM175 potassium channel family protein
VTDANQHLAAERLTFFSDAVVAIALTLLALDLHVPEVDSDKAFWHDVGRFGTDYIAFMISFAVIGSHWLLHHTVFSHLARVNVRLIRWNLLWLLMIVLTPFATKVIVADHAFAARLVVYAGIQALAAVLFLLAVVEMDRRRLAADGTDRALFTRSYHRLSAMAGAFLVSIPVAYLTGSEWAYACWVAIPVMWRLRTLAGRWRGARRA